MRGSPSASASRAAFSTAPRAQPPPIQPGDDGAVGADDRLGAGLGRGDRHRAYHGGQRKRLLGGLHLRHQVHHFDMRTHRSAHQSFAR